MLVRYILFCTRKDSHYAPCGFFQMRLSRSRFCFWMWASLKILCWDNSCTQAMEKEGISNTETSVGLWLALEQPSGAAWLWLRLRLSLEMLPEAKYLWNGNLREEWALLNFIFTNRALQLHPCSTSQGDSQGKTGWSWKEICCLLLPACLNWQEHSKYCPCEEQTISGKQLLPLALDTATWSSHPHRAPPGLCRPHGLCPWLRPDRMTPQLRLRAGPWELRQGQCLETEN